LALRPRLSPGLPFSACCFWFLLRDLPLVGITDPFRLKMKMLDRSWVKMEPLKMQTACTAKTGAR
jgi:hypothetical protein